MKNTTHSVTGKLTVCKLRLEYLLEQIKKINDDEQLSVSDKVSKIKIIKIEIDIVGQEVDTIKKEINLSKTYTIN